MRSSSKSRDTVTVRQQGSLSVPLLVIDGFYLTFALLFLFINVHPVISITIKCLGGLLVVLYIGCRFIYKLRTPPEMWCFAAFLLWALGTGLVVAKDIDIFWETFRPVPQSFAIALAVSGFAAAKRSAGAVMLSFVLFALVMLAMLRMSGQITMALESTRSGRLGQATGANPNFIGVLTVYGIMGLAYFWGQETKWWRFQVKAVIVPAAIGLAIGISATGSRKAFLGLLFFIGLWLWYCYRRLVLRNIMVLPFIAVVLAGGFFLTSFVVEDTYLGTRLQQFVEGEQLGGSHENRRFELYRTAFRVVAAYPIAGSGVGNFMAVSDSQLFTHSEYMEILTGTGIVGALLYFPIYLLLWRRVRKIGKQASDPQILYRAGLCQAVIVTLLAFGFVMPNFDQPSFWLLMAGMIGWSHGVATDMSREQMRASRASWPAGIANSRNPLGAK
jgi:O-antigen ligase